MDDSYEPRRKRESRNRARERQRRREERDMATKRIKQAAFPVFNIRIPALEPGIRRARLLLLDGWWYLRNTPILMAGIAGVIGLYFLLFAVSHVVQGRIFPNVYAFGVNIGDMTEDEAAARLIEAWNNELRIQLVDNDRVWNATTAQLGLTLDVQPVVEAARSVGMAGIPMGISVPPVVSMDFIKAQSYLLDLSLEAEIDPLNARYELRDGTVQGIMGSEGRMLDAGLTLEHMSQDLITMVRRRRLDLIIQPLEPDFIDPEPYLDEARAFVSQPFQMAGFDPHTAETINWSTTPETLATWLEAGANGLQLREATYVPFLEAQINSLNTSADQAEPRYLDNNEAVEKLDEAIKEQRSLVYLRVRYRPTTYEVTRGDSGFSIARKTGIPYYLIERANEGRDMDVLSVGDLLNLPSRDVSIPLDPVPNKRIIVDIETQSLVAYANGQEVFSWRISTGIGSAPTSPGIYQILNHDPEAYGSSFTLCGAQGCGQWTMYWFMGLYEVQPGLMNGFHGAVLLPNGSYLGGGNVGSPYTFGCVMSLDSNAKLLYDWADEGTPVEIISREFAPRSELGRRAFSA
jgi:hypothetical protein